ncbi:hypothetical protein TRIUR3_07200 [Triticum urartu]|uniref:Uncharacterized protein n=1 Tax=Triticum urartu TaxID=4572 RepID=M7YKJ7_TRIUA|nr:hypothetical protein TRIUR3_07200 [Triticum urartu]
MSYNLICYKKKNGSVLKQQSLHAEEKCEEAEARANELEKKMASYSARIKPRMTLRASIWRPRYYTAMIVGGVKSSTISYSEIANNYVASKDPDVEGENGEVDVDLESFSDIDDVEDHANLMVIDPVLIPESYLSTKNIESVLPPPALAPTAPCLLPPPPPTVPNLQQQLLPTVTVLAPTNLPPLPPATVKHPMVDWKETSVRAAEPSDDEHEWDLKARWCCGA